MKVDSQDRIGLENRVLMSTIIRKVMANSEAEAIGKFVLETNSITAVKKLNVECIKLSQLTTID